MWPSGRHSRTDQPWQAHEISGPEGVRFDPVELLDRDGDGDLDVLTCEETANLGVVWYENPWRLRKPANPAPRVWDATMQVVPRPARHILRMTSATIKLFLPHGDAKSLRTAEISNWTGKAVAAPRTELDELLAREELDKTGIYMLIGNDPHTNAPRAYIGEAEVIRERLKKHRTIEFWISAVVFVSKDENLTKARVRYLESRLIAEAAEIGRFTLEQNQSSGARLPESDREDMEVFLTHIRQLLPVLRSDILAPIARPAASVQAGGVLICRIKDAEARGQRTPNGFVVFQGSTAGLEERPSAAKYPYLVAQRKQLIADGTLLEKEGVLVFTRDSEFPNPSSAAVVIHGGSANGLAVWKTADGKSLKKIDERA